MVFKRYKAASTLKTNRNCSWTHGGLVDLRRSNCPHVRSVRHQTQPGPYVITSPYLSVLLLYLTILRGVSVAQV